MVTPPIDNKYLQAIFKTDNEINRASHMETLLFGKYDPVTWDIVNGANNLYWQSTDFVQSHLYARSYKHDRGHLKKFILFPELIKRPTGAYYTTTFYDSFTSAYSHGTHLEIKTVAKFPDSQTNTINILQRKYNNLIHIPSSNETILKGITPGVSLATNFDLDVKHNLNRNFGFRQVFFSAFAFFWFFMSKIFAANFKNHVKKVLNTLHNIKLLKFFYSSNYDDNKPLRLKKNSRVKRRKKHINFIGFSFKLRKPNRKITHKDTALL